ncbi:hypothetical protein CHU98_g10614, partial [Xylaria longipes]
MNLPREITRRRRYHSCPPNLKLCREPDARSRGHIMASHHFTSQHDVPHSRERTSTQAHHNAAVPRARVLIPNDREGVFSFAKHGLPGPRIRSRVDGRTLGVGPYWNPPRTTTTTTNNNTITTTPRPKGPMVLDCEWMRPKATTDPTTTTAAAAAAATKTT